MNWIATLPYVYGIRAHDAYLAAMPIVHSAGMTFALAYLNFGGTVFPVAHFDAGHVWHLIREQGITSGLFVPTMLQMLIEEDPDPKTPLPEIFHTIITAGSRIRPNLHAKILERFPNRLFTYYGSTESPSMTVLMPAEQETYPESVGRPYFGVELQVRNPRMLPDYPVRVGDIVARNPYAMDSYAIEGVPVPVSRDGWVETGDIGYFNEDGLLHVFGRASDVIISGGLNISLPEVERVIAAHPLVKDVAVVGIEDERWGELPAAAIVPIDARDANRIIEAIDAHCRSELAGYKRPRHIITLAELPRTASGKASISEIRTLIAVRVQA
jgi:acyl-CoA synthetase (AMP-forming)/AMP-acid ligase II